MNKDRIDLLARKIWNYHLLHHQLEKADCILVLGSRDTRVAERGAELYLEGWAPIILFSGGLGRLTKEIWNQTEAEKFAEVAKKLGVPEKAILTENKSTNSGENIEFSRQLLAEKGINPEKIIVVQKPYMERRTFATIKKVWPETEAIVTSPQLSFEEYLTEEFTKDYVINIMVGELQRIKVYPNKGFQIYQEIPDEVWDAYEQFVKLGYTKQLLQDT